MRRGTQQGDVYSFAIVMQEVVVRGEPFCMLSLSPEGRYQGLILTHLCVTLVSTYSLPNELVDEVLLAWLTNLSLYNM